MEKVCRICGESKPLDLFSKRPPSSSNDGHRNDCKACVVKRTSGRDRSDYLRTYRIANRDRLAEYFRQLPARDPEYFKAYRAANPERIRAIVGRSIRKNKAKRVAANHVRRATPMDQRARDYIALLLGQPCSYCTVERATTIDHIVPLSAGGTNDWWNLTGACKSCNSSKGTRSLLLHLLAS